jgi:hypothetical protein
VTAGDLAFVEPVSAQVKLADVKIPDVSMSLTVANNGTKTIRKIDVDVTPFSGGGATFPPAKSSWTIDSLGPSAASPIDIAVSLPWPGTYHAIVRMRQGGKLQATTTIEVTRVRAQPPIELALAQQAKIIELGLLHKPVDVTFNTTVAGTGTKVTLQAPVVKSVVFKESAKSEAGIVAADVDGKPDAKTVTIDKETSVDVAVTLTGIKRPGRYDATVWLGGGPYAPLPMTLTVYARQSWWVAALCIFVGVLVSIFLRFFGVVGRPSLLNKERANTLFRELDDAARLAGSDAYSLAAVQDVRRKLSDYWNGLSSARQLTNSAALDVYAAKITALFVWIQLRDRVKKLQPATLRATFEAKLDDAEKMLRNGGADAAAVKAQADALDGMPVEIHAALKQALADRLTKFADELRGDPRPQVQALLPSLQPVKEAIDGDRLDEAAAALDALQRRHIRILADALAARIGDIPPVGVQESDWRSATGTIRTSLALARSAPAAADAADAFHAALATFLRVVIAGLQAKIADLHDSNFKDDYEEAKPPLDVALALVDKDDLLGAWQKLDAAQQLFAAAAKKANSALGKAGDALAAAASGPAGVADFEIPDLIDVGISADDVARPGAMESFQSLRRAGEIVASLLILAAAILIGLQTLWIDQLTWGGWPSMIAAFLWGVAFDQFSHAGLIALIRKS